MLLCCKVGLMYAYGTVCLYTSYIRGIIAALCKDLWGTSGPRLSGSGFAPKMFMSHEVCHKPPSVQLPLIDAGKCAVIRASWNSICHLCPFFLITFPEHDETNTVSSEIYGSAAASQHDHFASQPTPELSNIACFKQARSRGPRRSGGSCSPNLFLASLLTPKNITNAICNYYL